VHIRFKIPRYGLWTAFVSFYAIAYERYAVRAQPFLTIFSLLWICKREKVGVLKHITVCVCVVECVCVCVRVFVYPSFSFYKITGRISQNWNEHAFRRHSSPLLFNIVASMSVRCGSVPGDEASLQYR